MGSENTYIAESKAFLSQHPLKAIKIRDKKFSYLDNQTVDKPSLILLHGSRGNPYVFWNQFKDLKTELRIISIQIPCTENAKEICFKISSLLLALSIRKINILGTSIGGYFAQWFTYYYPEKVNKLFISSSIIDGEGFNNPTRFFSRFIFPIIPYCLIKKRFKREALNSKKYHEINQYIGEMIVPNLSSKELSKRALAFYTNGSIPKLDFSDNNIVIIDCEDEPYIDKVSQQKVIERYPKAKHIRLETGHHFPYIIAAKKYNEILIKEINSP